MKYSLENPWNLSDEELREIFDLEVSLSNEIRNSTREERKKLYVDCYDRYFKRLPFHPQLLVKNNPDAIKRKIDFQMKIINRFITSNTVFLEIGAGDCSLSREVSNVVSKVFALDASEQISKGLISQDNIELVVTDCTELPFKENSIDLAYSNQLAEHLHPEDFITHLKSVRRVLKEGGKYICITPNRLSGPHDISRFFTNKNIGFHLMEYTNTELAKVLVKSGFKQIKFYFFFKGKWKRIPYNLLIFIESILKLFNPGLRKKILKLKPIKILLEINTVAIR
ncbi:MAG: hypothetical protein A2W91_12225 [Bacteroidetes bacterium GWF2_38_335]|nr:MAG: hypothetical protein A2W91_12225 [Bacteroidetes bacterium GWF2_38_335]OFY76937.1 MAG: hypothetical protein A2281_00340 [Bacteroidetes bacterium RIFOXYA12_FULL_38_20]